MASCGGVDGVDQPGDVLLVRQPRFERVHRGLRRLVRLRDGLEYHAKVVVVQVLVEEHGMIAFLLGLDLVPVGETVQTLVGEVAGEIEVEIGGIKFLVDLGVEQRGHSVVQHGENLL